MTNKGDTMSDVLSVTESLGIDTFSMSRLLRTHAADNLRGLARDIERGGESSEGDVDEAEFTNRAEAVWKIIEAAKLCDIDWQRQ